MKRASNIMVLLLAGGFTTAYADTAPVVDLTQSQNAVVNEAAISPEQRLTRVERQVSNISQNDLPGQIEKMRLEIQALRGQLEQDAHQLKLLNARQRQFYQDMDRRLQQLKQLNVKNVAPPATTSTHPEMNQTQSLAPDVKAYQTAVETLAGKHYRAARDQLQAYLRAYPHGKFRPEAYYWLGEIFYLEGQNQRASWQFK